MYGGRRSVAETCRSSGARHQIGFAVTINIALLAELEKDLRLIRAQDAGNSNSMLVAKMTGPLRSIYGPGARATSEQSPLTGV